MKIAALMYHEVKPDGVTLEKYAVAAAQFSEQMRYLHSRGYRSLTVDGYVAAEESPERAVMLTFDDGYASNYEVALPILEGLGFSATFFVSTAFVGRERRWARRDQIHDMAARGMSIQSHSHSHPFMTDLTPVEMREELSRSRSVLEEITGTAVRVFSCPGGRFDRRVLDAARQEGYLAVCTSRPSANRMIPGFSPAVVHRFLVGSKTSPETFRGIVELKKRVLLPIALRHRVNGLGKRVLGNRLYHRLWRRLH